MIRRYKFILFYLWRYKGLTFSILLLTVFGAFFYGFGIGLFVPLLEAIQGGGDSGGNSWLLEKIRSFYSIAHIVPTVPVLLGSIVIMVGLKVGITFWHNLLASKMCVELNRDLRAGCVENLLDVEISFYYKRRLGDLINIIVRETMEGAQSVYVFLSIMVQYFTLFMYGILMILLSWELLIVAVAIFFVVHLLIQFRIKRSHSIARRELENRNVLASYLLNIFSGIKIVNAYLRKGYETNHIGNMLEEARNLNFQRKKNGLLIVATSEPAMALCLALIIFLGVAIFKLNISVLITFLFILSRLVSDVTKLNTYRNTLALYIVPLQKSVELMSKNDKPYIIDGHSVVERFQRNIVLENVYFQYENDEKPVLKDICFDIQKDEVVALVGASGSGKSTLIELLLRFYDPNRGRILIDGIDLRDLNLSSWRQKIGVVLQDHFLFHDTIRNNIVYGKKNASEQETVEAAKKAFIHKDIIEFAQGYDTVVGERGVRLSGGQRQRIALARALIKNPKILILDEAMSSLDAESEHYIQNAIGGLRGGCTIIIVAHRFSTIEMADRIIVLENGEIVETGTHRKLLENKEHYARYYDLQYGLKYRQI